MARSSRWLNAAVVIGPLAFAIAVPLAMLAAASILPSQGATGGLTLEHYRALIMAPWFWPTVGNTLAVAVSALLIALVVGAPLAWLVARTDLPWPEFFRFMCTSPLFLSPLLAAVAWEMIGSPALGIIDFLTFGLFQPEITINGFFGCSVVMGFYFSTYVFLYLWPAFGNVDPAIEEAAAIAGLGPIGTFLRITIPTVLPAIAFVGALILVLAIGLFSIPAVLGWPQGFFVLSTRIFFLLSLPPISWGVSSALTVVFLPLIMLGLLIQRRIVRRSDFALVSGKTARDKTVKLGPWRWLAAAVIALYWFIVAGLPMIVIFVVSLTAYAGTFNNLTFKQYHDLLEFDLFARAVKNSLITSIVGATIAVAISVGLSYLIQRARPKWSSIVEYLVSLPLGVPGVVLSAALLWTWLALPFGTYVYGTLGIIIVACITQFLTSGVRSVSAVLIQIGKDVEESAWMSGATRLTTIRKILLPLLLPGMQSAWILLFVLFFRELSAVILLWSSQTITLPILSYEVWREGSYPRLAALGMVETALIALVVLVAQVIGGLLQYSSGGSRAKVVRTRAAEGRPVPSGA